MRKLAAVWYLSPVPPGLRWAVHTEDSGFKSESRHSQSICAFLFKFERGFTKFNFICQIINKQQIKIETFYLEKSKWQIKWEEQHKLSESKCLVTHLLSLSVRYIQDLTWKQVEIPFRNTLKWVTKSNR